MKKLPKEHRVIEKRRPLRDTRDLKQREEPGIIKKRQRGEFYDVEELKM